MPVSKPADVLGAISKDAAGAVVVDRAKCDLCGACAEACLYDVMQRIGREMTADEVLAEVEKNRVPSSREAASRSPATPSSRPRSPRPSSTPAAGGIRTALDTAGMSSDGVLDRLAAKTDLVLYDLVMDEVRHREMTGVSNAPILENLKRLAARGTAIWVRVPLVRGVNDDDDNIRRRSPFSDRSGPSAARLLPYHSGGLEKARRIGKEKDFRRFEPPSEERIAAVEAASGRLGSRSARRMTMNERIKKLRTQTLEAKPTRIGAEQGQAPHRVLQAARNAFPLDADAARPGLQAHHGEQGDRLQRRRAHRRRARPGAQSDPDLPRGLHPLPPGPPISQQPEEDRFRLRDEEFTRVYAEEIIPFWLGHSQRDRIFAEMTQEWIDAYEAGVFTEFMEQRAPGHTVLDGKISTGRVCSISKRTSKRPWPASIS